MKQTQRILLSALLILICFVVYQQKTDLVNLRTENKNILQSITKIENDIHAKLDLSVLGSCGIITNGSSHGSCVAIQSNLILTAGHCVDIPDTWVEIGGIRCKIKSKWRSSKHDVGFVVIDVNIPYLELGNNPGVLDEVYFIGSPHKRAFVNTISKGIVCKTNLNYSDIMVNWDRNFVCDVMSWCGGSGGPILKIDGKIVGIYVGLFANVDNFSICIPVSKIKEALKDRDEHY